MAEQECVRFQSIQKSLHKALTLPCHHLLLRPKISRCDCSSALEAQVDLGPRPSRLVSGSAYMLCVTANGSAVSRKRHTVLTCWAAEAPMSPCLKTIFSHWNTLVRIMQLAHGRQTVHTRRSQT